MTHDGMTSVFPPVRASCGPWESSRLDSSYPGRPTSAGQYVAHVDGATIAAVVSARSVGRSPRGVAGATWLAQRPPVPRNLHHPGRI